MPAKRALAEPRDVVYLYDGGLAGFFNCVYESVYEHELPAAIVTEQDPQRIAADPGRAVRVRNSIPKKISPRALELVENVFLSCMGKKEIHTLRFLLLGYEQGPRVLSMLGHPDVAPLLAAERHLGGECHLLKGFIRFSDYGGMLAATITPKNFVLPRLADEAEERYRALWKQFYRTIAIESRENPRCRMTHMPKRYWENMTEMREYL